MSLEYKILGQDLISYTLEEGTVDTTSYYVSYESTETPILIILAGAQSFSTQQFSYSTDAVTWKNGTVPYSGYYSIAYGNGVFVAAGPYGQASYSTDGITWTASTFAYTGTPINSGLVFINNVFRVGRNYSTDGITWSSDTNSLYSKVALGYVNGSQQRAVAVDGYETSNFLSYTDNGINIINPGVPSAFTGYTVNMITFGDGLFLAVAPSAFSLNGAGVKGFTSIDGITWTARDIPSLVSASYSGLVYGNGRFVLASSGNMTYSTDGVNWSAFYAGAPVISTYSISFTYSPIHKLFITAPSNSSSIYTSTDAVTWTMVNALLPTSENSFTVGFGVSSTFKETLNIIGGQGTAQTEELLPVTIYTVPEGKQTTVTSVYVANHDESESTYDFAVVPAGEELSLKHHIRWDMPVAGKDFEVINTKITMSAGDKLVIFPSTVDTVSVTAFGVEK